MNRKLVAALTAALTLVATLPIFAGAATDEDGSTLPLADFNDTNGHLFENAIDWLADQGITTGCNPPANTLFCPNQDVTRGQMAVFLSRALNLKPPLQNHFIDDNGTFYEGAANRLREAGITVGCNPPTNNRFCGNDPVTREQMATFIVRGFKPGLTNQDFFIDDNTSVHEGNINRIRAANITVGCNPPTNNRFCPRDPVTRGQMAAFLKRAVESLGVPPPPVPTTTTTTVPPPPGACDGITITPLSDCQALMSLYTATNGNTWLSKVGWTAGDPCVVPWEGVQCTAGRVTTVGLDANGLSGTIPNLSALTELRELDLGENSISGPIPATLGSLTKLQILRLEDNQLFGQIPTQLGSIGTQLTLLDLSNNPAITGSIPSALWNLTGLQSLNLSQMGLSGTLSANIEDLTGLTFFSLGETAVGGTLPASLTSLSALVTLNLSETQFTSSFPADIDGLTAIQTLDLEDSTIGGSIPTSIGNLANLTLLDLSGMTNMAGSTIPAELGNLAGLVTLDLSDIGLTGPIPTGLGGIGASLTTLDLSSNVLGGVNGADINSQIPGDVQLLTGLTAGSFSLDDQNGNCFTYADAPTQTFIEGLATGLPVCP